MSQGFRDLVLEQGEIALPDNILHHYSSRPTLDFLARGLVLVEKYGESIGNGVESNDLYMHILSTAGAVTSSFIVNQVTAGTQPGGKLIELGPSATLVLWTCLASGVQAEVKGRLLDGTFAPAGGEFLLATDAVLADVTRLADGRVLLVYTTPATTGTIRGAIYDPATGQVSVELALASGGAVRSPLVEALADGGFALATMRDEAGQSDILIQLFDATGATKGLSYQLPNTGHERLSDLGALHDGRLVVTWVEPNAGGARVQVLDPREGWVTGTAGDNVLVGSHAYDDIIRALDGSDTVEGLAGNDVIDLGGGNDLAWGGDGSDWFEGRAGSDWIVGDAGDDLASGGDDNDVISGGVGRDWLVGDAGNDAIWGGDEPDVISGGLGDDYITGEAGHDLIYGGAGNDVIVVGHADGLDMVFGEEGADTLFLFDRPASHVAALSLVGTTGQVIFIDGLFVSFAGIEWLQFADQGWALGS